MFEVSGARRISIKVCFNKLNMSEKTNILSSESKLNKSMHTDINKLQVEHIS